MAVMSPMLPNVQALCSAVLVSCSLGSMTHLLLPLVLGAAGWALLLATVTVSGSSTSVDTMTRILLPPMPACRRPQVSDRSRAGA
jgi:hypothetical protein